MIKLGVVGASGRTGSHLLKVLGDFPEFALVAALVSEQSKLLGTSAGGCSYSCDIAAALKSSEAIIDFSLPAVTEKLVAEMRHDPKPLLIATTGHSEPQLEKIRSLSARVPIVLASNTSRGVFVLNELTKYALELLGADCEVEIVEAHHRAKRDAPSGTAKTLAETVRAVSGAQIYFARSGAREKNEIGISSIRGGDIVGEHTVYLLCSGERIEITHRASDRSLFARGALNLMKRLVTLPAGLYSPADIFMNIAKLPMKPTSI